MKKVVLSFALLITALFAHTQTIPANPTDVSPLLIGEKIPDVTLTDTSGKPVSLINQVQQKPSVVVFYRGGWCPYCNLHLAELQTIEAQIIKAGYQIIAISPDSPESLKASIDKNKLNYLLLSDASSLASNAFGLTFAAPERYAEMLGKASDGKNTGSLPVPAVFVVNTQGEIIFEYINPDYKKRLKGSMLMAVLNELK
jgi:peroxiredoxin